MLAGKTALITGSTSGIGLGIAKALAEAGVHVTLNGWGDAAAIEDTRKAIEEQYKVKAHYHPADMSKPDEIRDLCAAAGPVDILVNNAGIQFVSPIDEFPDEKWDAIMAINLSAAFHTIKACLPGMRTRGWGRIINIASAHGLVASPYKSAYVAAKHGILGMTKSVALETATDNITVNAICPGYVLTPLVEGQIADQAKVHKMKDADVIENVILGPQPTKKFIQIEEVAAYALFLCSDAAQGITGAAQTMDGGWTAR